MDDDPRLWLSAVLRCHYLPGHKDAELGQLHAAATDFAAAIYRHLPQGQLRAELRQRVKDTLDHASAAVACS